MSPPWAVSIWARLADCEFWPPLTARNLDGNDFLQHRLDYRISDPGYGQQAGRAASRPARRTHRDEQKPEQSAGRGRVAGSFDHELANHLIQAHRELTLPRADCHQQ